ncbi:MAG: CDP-alcohol phosphatidyltransferase family protein [Granulosicoccaceae bacterium]
MLDKYIVPILKPRLADVAKQLQGEGIAADHVTLVGFGIGLACVLMLSVGQFGIALLLLLINRLADGVDGELARLSQPSDGGAYLDITLDFIFYAVFPLGFAFYAPQANALPAAVLIASFVGTGASFLAFSGQAAKQGMEHPDFGYKGFYYLNGLAEGTETILVFVLMCLLPSQFALIAFVFSAVCVLTAFNRVVFGYLSLVRPKK